VIGGYLYLKPGLPDVESLRTVQLQTPLQIFSADGQLIAQFGEKRRDPVRINEVPLDLVRAFLAAEDDNFRDHVGIDPLGLLVQLGSWFQVVRFNPVAPPLPCRLRKIIS